MAAKRSLAQLAYLGTSVALALKKPIVLTTYVYIYIYIYMHLFMPQERDMLREEVSDLQVASAARPSEQ